MTEDKQHIDDEDNLPEDEAYLKGNKNTLYTLYHFVSKKIAEILVKINVTANQITIFSIFVILFAGYLFSRGEHHHLIWGAILIQVEMLLDYIDGLVARMKKQTSIFGTFLDMLAGYTREPLIPFCICFSIYQQTQNVLIWIIGFLFLAESLLIRLVATNMDKFRMRDSVVSIKRSTNVFLKQFLNITYTKYVVILIGAILNQMFITMLILTIYLFLGLLGSLYVAGKSALASDNSK